MAVGLSCGMGYLLYGGIVAAILCIVMILLDIVKFGRTKTTQKLLKISIPENLDYKYAFDEIMQKHTEKYTLIQVKTTDLGSLYELRYKITSKDNIDEKSFIDELRCRNGNLTITLVLDAHQSEF